MPSHPYRSDAAQDYDPTVVHNVDLEAEQTRSAPTAPGDAFDFSVLAPPTRPDSIGRLGIYHIERVVGQGGMGVVFRAFDETLHRVVAIKLLAPGLATNPTARQRFVREARAAAAVRDPHVVAIHAVSEAGDVPYIVMEFVEGRSLQEKLDVDGRLPLAEVLRIGIQIADGLTAAHRQGLVHRDIKPANILLENHVDRVKLSDFGLARAIDDASLSRSGAIAGTPLYMSPEQARGEPVDHRSDLFSLGSVLYAMVTGQAPFQASGAMAVMKRVCDDEPPPLQTANPDAPAWLADVIAKLHAKSPGERFASAAEVSAVLGRQLARLQAGEHGESTDFVPRPMPRTVPRQPRRTAVVVAVIALLVSILSCNVVGLVWVLLPQPARMTVAPLPPPTLTVPPQSLGPATSVIVPYSILRPDGKLGSVYFSLDKAIAAAGPGETIQVYGPGPYDIPAVTITKNVRIVAGRGAVPVLRFTDPSAETPSAVAGAGGAGSLTPFVVRSGAVLTLEGLAVYYIGSRDAVGVTSPSVVQVADGRLQVANCRFVVNDRGFGAVVDGGNASAHFRNTEFHGSGMGCVLVSTLANPNLFVTLDNCLSTQRVLILDDDLQPYARGTPSVVNVRRTTHIGQSVVEAYFRVRPTDDGKATRPTQYSFDRCVFDLSEAIVTWYAEPIGPVSDDRMSVWLNQAISWSETDIVHAMKPTFAKFDAGGRKVTPAAGTLSMLTSARVTSTRPQFATPIRDPAAPLRGDLLAPADFRLRPDSPGHRLGPNGTDLGIDGETLGPTKHDSWKATAEYKQWQAELELK